MTSLAWLLAASLLATGAIQEPAAPGARATVAGATEAGATASTSGPRPSLDHDRLDALAGTWKFEKTTSLPGQAIERTTGISENHWILDNHYLECRAREGEGSSSIENIQLYGFDTRRRTYFSFAVGSRATGYRSLEGFYDGPTRALVLLGKDPGDLRTGGVKLRQVLTIESRDRHHLELFVVPPGRLPQKVMEIVYSRS